MTEPYIGEVQIFGFNFAPAQWSFANGSLIPVRQNTTLYALYGATFGGDGITTFGIPNLASQHACGAGQSPGNSNRVLGQLFGTMSVALNAAQLPAHSHVATTVIASDPTTLTATPQAGGAVGSSAYGTFDAFAPSGSGTVSMAPGAVAPSGNGTPHENRQPFLGLNYCVSLMGTYPSFP